MSDANYTETIRKSIESAQAPQLQHLGDRALLAFGVISEAFEQRFPTEFAAWNPGGEADPPDATEALYAAVQYVLDRIQDNPDVGYYLGVGTQMFSLLCQAEAAHTGRPLADVERDRREDRQPPYRRREPEAITLREERDQAREASECGRHWGTEASR